MQNYIAPVTTSGGSLNYIAPVTTPGAPTQSGISPQEVEDFFHDSVVTDGRDWVGRKWVDTTWTAGHSVMGHWEWEGVDPRTKQLTGGWALEPPKSKQFIWSHRVPKRQVIFHIPLRHLTVKRAVLSHKVDMDKKSIHLDRDGWVQLQVGFDIIKDAQGNPVPDENGNPQKKLSSTVVHGFDDVDVKTQAKIADKLVEFMLFQNPNAKKIKIDNGTREFRKAMEEALVRYNNAHNTTIELTESSKPAPEAQKMKWWNRRVRNNLHSFRDNMRYVALDAISMGGKAISMGSKAVSTGKKVGSAVRHPGRTAGSAGRKIIKAPKKFFDWFTKPPV
ncbi:MAG: hypothetical protein PHW76_06855 [Alphaproteobacteria bacterium]|nr:hypothetical protein [Alphaproteobacteria bacterium]